MYIGSTDVRGLHHLVREIVDNSVDEALGGHADTIVTRIGTDGVVTVTDNGRGIPVDKHAKQNKSALEVIMTILHAGGKFGGGGYKVSGGLHGVGASVVNALSKWCRVEVRKDGKVHVQEYEYGVPTGPLRVIGETAEHGTTVSFLPDAAVFETLDYEAATLAQRRRARSTPTSRGASPPSSATSTAGVAPCTPRRCTSPARWAPTARWSTSRS